MKYNRGIKLENNRLAGNQEMQGKRKGLPDSYMFERVNEENGGLKENIHGGER